MATTTTCSSSWLDHHDLLDRAPLRIETGLSRLHDGCLQVSVRTDLHGCKGRMLDWWFTFFETTQHIRWWHPLDHVEHRGWDAEWRKGRSYYGASICAVEALADIAPVPARLKFHDPAEIFAPERLQRAQAGGDVAAIIAARIGFGEQVEVDDQGDPRDGEMLHVARDTPFGCVLRSRFVLGRAASDPQSQRPDRLGLGLMRHCYTEFSFLAGLLPSLYYGERANDETVPLPW